MTCCGCVQIILLASKTEACAFWRIWCQKGSFVSQGFAFLCMHASPLQEPGAVSSSHLQMLGGILAVLALVLCCLQVLPQAVRRAQSVPG